jgi:hypothetical protein
LAGQFDRDLTFAYAEWVLAHSTAPIIAGGGAASVVIHRKP